MNVKLILSLFLLPFNRTILTHCNLEILDRCNSSYTCTGLEPGTKTCLCIASDVGLGYRISDIEDLI